MIESGWSVSCISGKDYENILSKLYNLLTRQTTTLTESDFNQKLHLIALCTIKPNDKIAAPQTSLNPPLTCNLGHRSLRLGFIMASNLSKNSWQLFSSAPSSGSNLLHAVSTSLNEDKYCLRDIAAGFDINLKMEKTLCTLSTSSPISMSLSFTGLPQPDFGFLLERSWIKPQSTSIDVLLSVWQEMILWISIGNIFFKPVLTVSSLSNSFGVFPTVLVMTKLSTASIRFRPSFSSRS